MEIRKFSSIAICASTPITNGHSVLNAQESTQSELISSKASTAMKSYAIPQVSFENRYEKMIDKVVKASNPAKVQLRYEEACGILEHLGYRIRHTTGSHVVANIANEQPIVIVHPHGNDKYVHAGTITDLKKILGSHAA